MKSSSKIEISGVTDVGCVRPENEDCFLIQPMAMGEAKLNGTDYYEIEPDQDIFVVVSDGMGGAASGEIASSTGVESVAKYLVDHHDELRQATPEQTAMIVEKGIHFANQAIITKALDMHARKGMGATMTAVYIKKNIMYVFQIGDSRAYAYRNAKLCKITRDQSFVGHLVEMGTITEEQAMKHPQRNVILQALGTQDNLRVDVSYLPLCKNDIILLCSDGLYGEFMPEKLKVHANVFQEKNLQESVQFLVDAAKRSGGKDNITVVGIRVGDGAPEQQQGEEPKYLQYPYHEQGQESDQAQSLFR